MRKRKFYIVSLLLLCCLQTQAVKVVFRLDDPTVRYDSVHSRILQLFIEKNVPLSVAVIPCDSNEVAFEPNDAVYLSLLNAPNIEVCLHGLTHTHTHTHTHTRARGEFGSLNKVEIERRLRKGKEILNTYIGKDVITFIPPWNAINDSIHEILVENGFRIMSAELFNPPMPVDYSIQYYPEALGDLIGTKGMWNAADASIFGCGERQAICVVMFHAYDLPNEESWGRLEDLLDRCKEEEDVELYTFASLYESGERADGLRYNANLLSSGLKKWLIPKGVMHPTWFCYLVHALNALLHALIWILACMIVLGVKNIKNRKYLIPGMICALLVIIGMAWWHVLTPLKLVCFVLTISLLSALIVPKLRK